MNIHLLMHLVQRSEGLVPRQEDATSSFEFLEDSASADQNELYFAAVEPVRRSIVVLASFNAIAGFATAAGIFWDCHKKAQRRDPEYRLRMPFWRLIGASETYPFILSCGVVAQGVMYAVAQSKGLTDLIILGCAPISQYILPATFIVPYIQLVFGLETATRALWRNPFPKRLKWTTPACVAIVFAGLLINFGVTQIQQAPNYCFASLFWYVQQWSLGCFALLCSITGILLLSSLIVLLQLRRSELVDYAQRSTASWMIWYMAVAIMSNTLLLPYFYLITFDDVEASGGEPWELAMITCVAANLSGPITGGLYLFLRSSRFSPIGPKGFQQDDHLLAKSEKWVEDNEQDHHEKELPQSPSRLYKTDAMAAEPARSPREARTQSVFEPDPPTSQAVDALLHTLNRAQEALRPIIPSWGPRSSQGSSTYSPDREYRESPTPKPLSLLPAVAYSPEATEAASPVSLLVPPVPILTTDGARHRRDSSLGSSATVQIGLRLSNVNDMAPLTPSYIQNPNQVYDLGCPNVPKSQYAKKSSPLVQATVPSPKAAPSIASTPTSPIQSPNRAVVAARQMDEALSPSLSPTKRTQPRVTSPRGVGFSSPVSRSRAGTGASSPLKEGDWI